MNLLNFDKNKLKKFEQIINENNFPITTNTGLIDEVTINKDYLLKLQKRYFYEKDSSLIETAPPFEWHPYKEMEDFNKPIIIVGTFPPPSYLRSNYKDTDRLLQLFNNIGPKQNPELDFFYGNKNSLWNILGIEKNNVKNYLKSNNIGISDIINSCQRNNINSSSDKDLKNIIINKELIEYLTNKNETKQLVFTSGAWDVGVNYPKTGRVKPKFSAFSLFLETIKMLGGSIEFKVSEKWVKLDDICSARIIRKIRQNIIINLKWEIGSIKSPDYKALLLPSPSSITDRSFMKMLIFKKWLKWENKNAFEILMKLEGEKKGMANKAHSKKIFKLNNLLKANGFIKENEDIKFVFKSAIYKMGLSGEQNNQNLNALENIDLDEN
jgi:hypothetical protein